MLHFTLRTEFEARQPPPHGRDHMRSISKLVFRLVVCIAAVVACDPRVQLVAAQLGIERHRHHPVRIPNDIHRCCAQPDFGVWLRHVASKHRGGLQQGDRRRSRAAPE